MFGTNHPHGRDLHGEGDFPPQKAKTRREMFSGLPPKLVAGEHLEHFEIEGEVAHGSAATIFAAKDGVAGRRVALKVLAPHLLEVPEALLRFEAEWQLARRVSHPGIIPVYTWGHDERHAYYAMRLEAPQTALDLDTQMDPLHARDAYERLALLYAGVARAVAAVHDENIVHRDLKPQNLVLSADGQLLLCDFGSALDAHHRDPRLEDCLWGTVDYMSPEQFRPEADPYDARSDIYALGVCLFEAATGISPFPVCKESELVRWKLSRHPPSPRRVNPTLPLAFDAVIRRAMNPDVHLRYQSARELARDLERLATRKRGCRR